MTIKKIIKFILVPLIFLTSCNTLTNSNAYNVYFFTDNKNATVVETIFNVEPGDLIDKPDDPVKPGFEFQGWYLDLSFTKGWNFEIDVMPEKSIVFYAKWGTTIRTITYNLNGGEMIPLSYPTTYVPGESFVFPQAKRTGYTFRGWYLYDQVLANYPNNEGTKPGQAPLTTLPTNSTDDIVLYAHWSAIKTVVTFRSNHPGGTTVVPNPSSLVMSYGTVINYGENFPNDFGTVNGYVFLGWNSRADGQGVEYSNGSVFIRTLAITLYGQWRTA
jgi:uncharacterized repeat protein (TIGR02543 family)